MRDHETSTRLWRRRVPFDRLRTGIGGQPVKLERLGTYTPTVKLDGKLGNRSGTEAF